MCAMTAQAAAMRWTTERAIDGIATTRHGVVSVDELRSAGVSRARRATAVRRGGLVVVRPGVYRVSGAAMSDLARARAACSSVGPHAVVSHRSALWLWDLAEHPGVVELVVPVGRRSEQPGLIVHRSTDLLESHCCNRYQLPVTKPARALLDAAAVLPRPELGEAVEQALIDRLVTVAGLRRMLDELGRRGRRGAGGLRSYLDTRALVDRRAESQLEPLMARLCRDHGVGPVLFQEPVVLDGREFRPDFQIPDVRLAIEVDGLDAHRARAVFDSDLARQNAFIRNGWLVLRYSSTHLRAPARVAREIIGVAQDRRIAARAG